MQHLMPDERATQHEPDPITEQRHALPAMVWAVAIALIVLGGWLELHAATVTIHLVEAQQAASMATPPR